MAFDTDTGSATPVVSGTGAQFTMTSRAMADAGGGGGANRAANGGAGGAGFVIVVEW